MIGGFCREVCRSVIQWISSHAFYFPQTHMMQENTELGFSICILIYASDLFIPQTVCLPLLAARCKISPSLCHLDTHVILNRLIPLVFCLWPEFSFRWYLDGMGFVLERHTDSHPLSFCPVFSVTHTRTHTHILHH